MNRTVRLLIALLVLSTSFAYAQKDTTKLRLGATRFLIIPPPKEANIHPNKPYKWNNLVWMGFDVGFVGFTSLPGYKAQPQGDYAFMKTNIPRSIRIGFNLWEGKFRLNKKRTVNILTGMGFDWYHYSFEDKIILRETDDLGPINPGDPGLTNVNNGNIEVLRSRLQVTNFNIPLMLNFRTLRTFKHKKQFNFTLGVVGGVRIGSNFRHSFTQDGDRLREVRKDDFLLRRFKLDAEVRVRWYVISLFGRVSLIEAFNNQGPTLYPWSAGIHIQPF